MRLDPPPKLTMRVHELAKELGWPSSRLLAELRRRGEYVKSAMSTIEAPVVRAIRRDFAAAVRADIDPDDVIDASLYGKSAEIAEEDDGPDETFAAAVARIKSQPPRQQTAASKTAQWRPAILQALLDEVIAHRPEHLAEPSGGHFGWELKKAEKLHLQWAKARLIGLDGDDATVIKWIRLSGGERPSLAAQLSSADITPDEAGLHLGYGGRIDPRMATLYERFRDRRITRSEVIAAVRQRRHNAAS
jgi:hypothetical protein